MVEHRSPKPGAVGSSPSAPAICFSPDFVGNGAAFGGSDMKTTPYWWDTLTGTLTPTATDHWPSKADIVVIGGGFTGLSAALVAARQGRSVVVFDAGMPGLLASTRNGGICSGHIRLSHAVLTARYGKAFADGVYREAIEARADLAEFCRIEKIDCALTQAGHFSGALSVSDYDKLGRQCDALNGIAGHDVEIIPRENVSQQIDTDYFHGGLLRREIGGYHPGQFYAGLLRVVEAAGVQIFADTAVKSIASDGASHTAKQVITERGTVNAGAVIVASNAYTGLERRFHPFLRNRLVPVQSAIIVTEHLGRDAVKALMPSLRMYGNTAKLSCYFRPTPDETRILFGSRSFDKLEPSHHSVDFLKKKLAQILPQLIDVKIDYCWLGNVAFNRQMLPAVFSHDGIYYSAGYAGSGTVWARWLGKKAAELACDMHNQKSASLSVFYRKPPKAIPFYDGRPWFMPFVNRWFAFRDWLSSKAAK